MAKPSIPRVLIIAGSDSGGGAGIQGDIKTVTCLGGYASTAITALTAQNTQGVFDIHDVPLPFLRRQIELVLADIGADAIKTGMLHSAGVVETVAQTLGEHGAAIPLVVDPVMVAKGGAPLLQEQAVAALESRLLPMAALVTPNIPEAEILSGITIRNEADMQRAAEAMLALGCKAVLVKGGHAQGDEISNVLLSSSGMVSFRSKRLHTRHTHGTGCTLASAIATGLAAQMPLAQSVERAIAYVEEALQHAPELGSGHGPLGHNFALMKS